MEAAHSEKFLIWDLGYTSLPFRRYYELIGLDLLPRLENELDFMVIEARVVLNGFKLCILPDRILGGPKEGMDDGDEGGGPAMLLTTGRPQDRVILNYLHRFSIK